MTTSQMMFTIAVCALATMATRFLPFLLFSDKRPTPSWGSYLGRALPPASYALLVVYSLRHVDLRGGSHGLAEFLAIGVTAILYFWKKGMILPIAGGTLTYMILVQYLF